MVSEHKKKYMHTYNQKPEVKAKKAAYMRKMRAEKDKDAAKALVRLMLDLGYGDLAFDFAKERAPEMLVTAKVKSRTPRKA